MYIGKGFGDVGLDWARPFAITGEVDYNIPTHPIDATIVPDPVSGLNTYSLTQNPTVLTYGVNAAIQLAL